MKRSGIATMGKLRKAVKSKEKNFMFYRINTLILSDFQGKFVLPLKFNFLKDWMFTFFQFHPIA